MRRLLLPLPALLMAAAVLTAATAQAAKPQSWSFSTQHDYADGKFNNTIVDSYGQLSLGRSLAPIDIEQGGESIGAFAQTPDGAVYAAISGEAKIYKIDADGKKGSVVYKAPKGFAEINAMTSDASGNLLVGLSGDTARLVRVNPHGDDGKATSSIRFEDKDVSYIWSILQGPDGATYIATGPHGKVYKLSGDAEPTVTLETAQKNVTSLAFDKAGNLIAGTDAHGLVIRADSKNNKPFVLLDAGKVDVNAIVTDAAGNLYVATAKAEPSDQEPDDSGMSDEPDTKSKPAVPETQPVDPSPDDSTTVPASQHAMLWTRSNMCPAPELPADMKALMKKMDAAKKKPKSAPTLPGKSSKSALKGMHSDESDASEDASTVYRISADGTVTTLVQDAGMSYSLLLAGDELLIGTGPEGKLFSYRLSDQSLSLIARVKEQEISTLFADRNGAIFIGTGDTAKIYQMGAGLAATGTFTSQVLDASHTANWGHAWVDRTLADGTKVTVATRSGNTEDVETNEKFWSEWSAESDEASPKIISPAARFLQYRVTLAGGNAASPIVSNLRIGYQTQNLPPRLKSVSVDLAGPGSGDDSSSDEQGDHTDEATPANIIHLTWDASDPNNDTLVYRIYYKQANNDKDPWTLLARDVKEILYDWDSRSVPDGKYQVKVVASDSPDNPATNALETARTSAPFTIDHTPPAIGDLTSDVDGNKVKISGEAKDAISPVVNVRYQIDGQGDWQPAAASDKIFDSPQEAFTIVTRPLSSGAHRITVRATDAAGNSSYKAVTISVKS